MTLMKMHHACCRFISYRMAEQMLMEYTTSTAFLHSAADTLEVQAGDLLPQSENSLTETQDLRLTRV